MKALLDRITGRFTMYRTVTITLLAILAVALVLSLTGVLFYPPLDLLASLAVASASVFGTAALVRLVTPLRPHWESSAITALLVFFLLFPSSDPAELWITAVAGAVATVSKYLIAWRGRHIVNPAAFGVLAVTATGLSASAWWPGTPPLLPIVALGALLVLYRSGRVSLGVVFVVVAVAILTVRSMTTGMDVLPAIGTALGSYPTVFLAGFMLSEPLTLPPRRWQQYLVAVVVAVLFAVPFSIGPVFSSPELALVIGNLVAFALRPRRAIALTVSGKRALTPSVREVAFAPSAPVHFAPGQYVELTLPHGRADSRGSRRIFSIASPPADDRLAVAFRVPEKASTFKRALTELPEGAVVRGTVVGGDFTLPRDPRIPLLLIAGGIGITPFRSQLDAIRTGRRDVVLVYVCRGAEDIAYREELEASGVPVVLVAPDDPGDLPAHWRYAGPRLDAGVLAEVPAVAERRAYISGSPALVDSARKAARAAGVRRIRKDYFSGY